MLRAPARPTDSLVGERVHRAQGGDPAAFEELFHDYAGRLRRAVAKRIGPELIHHLDPDDVVQETFLSAFLALDRYEVREGASFYGWLLRIALRKLRDTVRYHRRDKRTPSATYFEGASEGLARGSGEPDVFEDPLERLGAHELGQIVLRCLERLAPEQREVVLLRECAEEPWKRVAQLLGGRTVGGVRHLHLQAVGELTRQITLSVGGRVGLGLS